MKKSEKNQKWNIHLLPRKAILPFQNPIFTDGCQPKSHKTWNAFLCQFAYQSNLQQVNIVSCNPSSNCKCALSVKTKNPLLLKNLEGSLVFADLGCSQRQGPNTNGDCTTRRCQRFLRQRSQLTTSHLSV